MNSGKPQARVGFLRSYLDGSVGTGRARVRVAPASSQRRITHLCSTCAPGVPGAGTGLNSGSVLNCAQLHGLNICAQATPLIPPRSRHYKWDGTGNAGVAGVGGMVLGNFLLGCFWAPRPCPAKRRVSCGRLRWLAHVIATEASANAKSADRPWINFVCNAIAGLAAKVSGKELSPVTNPHVVW